MRHTYWLIGLTLIGCKTDETSDTIPPQENAEIDMEWGTQNDDSDNDSSNSDNQDEGASGCGDSWVMTYAIDGRVDITHTPLNIGNAEAFVGGLDTDELVIRMADDNGKPANGQILMTHFDLLQDFVPKICWVTSRLSPIYT